MVGAIARNEAGRSGAAGTEAAVRAYVKLLRASRAVVAMVEPRLVAEHLTLTQFGVLEAVLHKGPLTQRELTRKVLTSAGNMTDVIDKLAARGLVQRVPCPEDRRSVRIVLTPCGRALVERLFPLHAEDIARAMAGLDAGETGALDGLLRTLGHAAQAVEPLASLPCPSHLRR
ncbi:MAG TPA: MarR family transcriptional regulator [Acetobacteraceae bacterium]|nr:MarR family transcriptional regulator [Acetobacteraceae bacterium]